MALLVKSACYHNGNELLNGEVATASDGDFFVCWLDTDTGRAASVAAPAPTAGVSTPARLPATEQECSVEAGGIDNAGSQNQKWRANGSTY